MKTSKARFHGNQINKEFVRAGQKVRNYLRRKVRRLTGASRDFTRSFNG